jgi:hypothetical protein
MTISTPTVNFVFRVQLRVSFVGNMTHIPGGRRKIFKYSLDVFRGWKTEEQYIDLQDPR